MPESCKDRSATAIEYVFLLTKSQRYFYDHEAVKIEASPDSHARYGRARSTDHKYADADRKYFKSVKLLGGVVAGVNPKARKVPSNWDQDPGHHEASHRKGRAPRSKQNESFSAAVKDVVGSRARRNSDWFMTSWQGLLSDDDGDPMAFIVNPKGFKEAHFATFPPMLVEPCVKAGTSEKGCCPECGAPWVRVTGKPERVQGRVSGNLERKISAEGERSRINTHMGSSIPWETTVTPTLAWRPTCTHGHEPIPCVVLDPFGGSGTVGNVARDLGRSFILIELKPEYCEMSKRRVEDLTTPVEVVRRG